MNLSGHFSGSSAFVRIFIAVVCLALVVQGAHVCQPAESSAAGVGAVLSLATPMCPVCALSHSLLITLLLILFSVVPTRSRTLLVSVQPRSFWRGIQLDMRAPPVL